MFQATSHKNQTPIFIKKLLVYVDLIQRTLPTTNM